MMRRWYLVGASLVALAAACGSGSDKSFAVDPQGRFQSDAGEAGSAPLAQCVAASTRAVSPDLDLYVAVDRSGSMAGAKWSAVQAGIDAFAKDPTTLGVSVGLTFFPPVSPLDPSSSAYCTSGDVHHDRPDVPLGALPANAALVASAFASTAPLGGTPIYPALLGTLRLATARKAAFPSHLVAVLLATDGLPTYCQTNPTAFEALARSAHDYDGVLTFTLGLPESDPGFLGGIALAGGTGHPYDVLADAKAFASALVDVRHASIACRFALPTTTKPELTNVRVGNRYTVPRVTGAGECGDRSGWYPEVGSDAATTVVLCDASCRLLQGDPAGNVDILSGCPSEVR